MGFSLNNYNPSVSVVAAGLADCAFLNIDIPRRPLLGAATTSCEESAHCPSFSGSSRTTRIPVPVTTLLHSRLLQAICWVSIRGAFDPRRFVSELKYCMLMCLPTLLLPSPSITRYTPRPAGAAASATAASWGQVQVSPFFRSPISIAISSAAAAPVGVGGRRSPSAADATAAAAVAATIAGTSMTVVVVAVPVQRQARVVIPVLPHSPLPSSPCCAAVA